MQARPEDGALVGGGRVETAAHGPGHGEAIVEPPPGDAAIAKHVRAAAGGRARRPGGRGARRGAWGVASRVMDEAGFGIEPAGADAVGSTGGGRTGTALVPFRPGPTRAPAGGGGGGGRARRGRPRWGGGGPGGAFRSGPPTRGAVVRGSGPRH